MPTESFKKLLDRDLAVVNASELADLTSSLLRELVNHGTQAFARCQLGVTGEEGVDFAAFILFRHVTELTDAVEVLLANSCVPPTIPLLRSSLEATLGLDYLLSTDSKQFRSRALAWLCVYIHKRLELYDLVEPDKKLPQRGYVQQERRSVTASEAKANLAKSLEPPYMEPIEEEYQRLVQRRRNPTWYSLFGGPANLRELAKQLGREDEYTHLYRHWSTFSHGGDAASGFAASSSGGVAFKALRSPERLLSLANLAALYQLDATRLMIKKFRGGESLEKWYVEEVRPKQEALRSLEVRVTTVESEDL